MERFTIILFLGGIFVCHGYVDKCYCPGDTDFNIELERKMWELRTQATKDFEVVFKPRPPKEGVPEISILKKMFPELSVTELSEMTLDDFNKYREDAKDQELERKHKMEQHAKPEDKFKESQPGKKPEGNEPIKEDTKRDEIPTEPETEDQDSTSQNKEKSSPTDEERPKQGNSVPDKKQEDDGNSRKTRKRRQAGDREGDETPPRPPVDDPKNGDSLPRNQTDRPQNGSKPDGQGSDPKDDGKNPPGTENDPKQPQGTNNNNNNETSRGNSSRDDSKPIEGENQTGNTYQRPTQQDPNQGGNKTLPKDNEQNQGERQPKDERVDSKEGGNHTSKPRPNGEDVRSKDVQNDKDPESKGDVVNSTGNRTQAGDKPPQEGSKPPQEGNKPPQEGSKPPQEGNKTPQEGSRPPQEGSKPPQEGSRPPQEGSKPPQEGSRPPQEGSKPPHEGSRPPQEGSRPPQEGNKPPQEGNKPPQEGNKPPQEGNKPPQEGSRPPLEGSKHEGDGKEPDSNGAKQRPTNPVESRPNPGESGTGNQKSEKPSDASSKPNSTPKAPTDANNQQSEKIPSKERPKPKPMTKDSAKPVDPIGVLPVSGSLKRAQACSCPAKSKIMKKLTFDQVEPDPKLEDTTSEEFAKFKNEQETILNEALGKNDALKSNGFAGINILSATIGPKSSRRKRETNAVTAQTQSECTGSCDPNAVDAAVNGTNGVSSNDPATAASPCSKSSLTTMTNPPPSHLINNLANDAVIDSSFYIHLTCSRSVSDEYRQYQETAPVADDSLDNKVGVLCNDGAFTERTWPDESKCTVVDTCANIPSPPPTSLLLPPETNETATGSSVFFLCSDPEALLDDGSGLNSFEVKCEGTQLKVNRNGSMVDFDPATHFPTCLSQCKTLFIGNKQYRARIGNGTTPVIRAGETLPFDCPFGMYVESMAYDISSVDGECLPDGKFKVETRKCFLVPCTQEDIDGVPPPDNNGDLVTTAVGEIMPAESIFFKCSDPLKVPSNGKTEIEALCLKGGNFSVLNWPTAPYCLQTCSNFPNITKMTVVDRSPVLEGKSVEYKCRNTKKIPATGEKVLVPCEAGGKFQHEDAGFPGTNYPDCVTGCVVFPSIENFKPKLRLPLLPGLSVEYECERKGFIPHTDANLVMECQANGTLTPTTAIPQCVPMETCRQKDYPIHPSFAVFDNKTVSYRQNELLQMVCASEDLVAETQNFSSITFGIKCIKNATTSQYQFEGDIKWPRCIPKKCIKFMTKHHNLTNTCQCGFDECSEYIYSTIQNQCPEVPNGPYCSLDPYHDWSEEIAGLFQGDPPTEVPTASELTQLAVMETELDMTIAEIEAFLSAEPNSTTQVRRKRSNVPLLCSELQAKIVKVQDMLAIGVTNKVFPISEIILQCSFLRRSTVTKEDCDKEKVDLTSSLSSLKTKVDESKTTIEELIEDNKAAEIIWAKAVAEANAIAENETLHRLEQAKTIDKDETGSNSTTEGSKETHETQDATKKINASGNGKSDDAKTNSNSSNNNNKNNSSGGSSISSNNNNNKSNSSNSSSSNNNNKSSNSSSSNSSSSSSSSNSSRSNNNNNNNKDKDKENSSSTTKTRKKRAAFIKTLVRQKRGLMFRCNTSMVYGISFKDMYHPEGIMADRCCCPDFRGEFFRCMATIDSPWNNVLSSVRSAFFKEKFKMVEQEIRYLIRSTNYSEIAMTGQLGNFSFIGLNNTGNKIGAVFHIVLKWPHWDNHARIEHSFLKAAEMYANQTEEEEHILGKEVQGRFERNMYVLESGKKGIECIRSPFPELTNLSAKNGSDALTSVPSDEDENGWLVFVMVPLSIICFLGILIYLVFKSKACLIRYWV